MSPSQIDNGSGATGMRMLVVCGIAGALLLAGSPLAQGFPEVWAALLGLVLGPVFPMLVAATGERFSHARGAATGLVVGTGSLGGVILPWAAGLIGEATSVVWAIASLGVASLGLAPGLSAAWLGVAGLGCAPGPSPAWIGLPRPRVWRGVQTNIPKLLITLWVAYQKTQNIQNSRSHAVALLAN